MRRYTSTCLLAAVFSICLWGIETIHALTIYRIGGEGLPPPALEAPFEFVQLPWSGVEAAKHGKAELLEMAPGFIRPQQLDPNVNLTPLLGARGGQILSLTWIGWGPAAGRDLAMFDGDPRTAFLGDGDWGGDYGVIKNKTMIFDLGGLFRIQRIRFFPRERYAADRFVEKFLIGINDGDPLKNGTREHNFGGRGGAYDFDIAHDIAENTKPVIDLEMPKVPIRQILFEAPENTRGIWEIAEFEIYGTGFAPFAGYESNVIDLGVAASLGSLSWSGQEEGEGRVALSMRSGDDEDPNTYWRYTFRGDERSRFDAKGQALTGQSYAKLESAEKAGITYDTEHWEFWSTPYGFAAGEGLMAGDKPRRYVQFRADFSSGEQASGRLDFLQFAVSMPPVASEVVAEIAPVAVAAGAVTSFTYRLRPRLRREDLGFDRLEIDTPARPVRVEGVRISGQEVKFSVERWDERGFVVGVPRVDAQQTGELIEVRFAAEVFKFGTIFSGRVYDSRRPYEVHQGVTGGEADGLSEGAGLSVGLSEVGQRTIQRLGLSPAGFTPNGDGVNDVVEIEYDLVNLGESVPVEVGVYDLSGRWLGQVYRGVVSSGRFRSWWEGRDGGGKVLPPGLYILRLEVEADQGRTIAQRVVSLVY